MRKITLKINALNQLILFYLLSFHIKMANKHKELRLSFHGDTNYIFYIYIYIYIIVLYSRKVQVLISEMALKRRFALIQ